MTNEDDHHATVVAAARDLLAVWDRQDRAGLPAEVRHAVESLRGDLVPDDAYDPRPYVDAQTWTTPRNTTYPHEYVTEDASTDPAAHLRLLDWLRRTGQPERFQGRTYRYAEVDGFRYWCAPGTILNRRPAVPRLPGF